MIIFGHNINEKRKNKQANFFLFQEKYFYSNICEDFKRSFEDFEHLADKIPVIEQKMQDLILFYLVLLETKKIKKPSIYIIEQLLKEGFYSNTKQHQKRLKNSNNFVEAGTFIKPNSVLRKNIYTYRADSGNHAFHKETFQKVSSLMKEAGILDYEYHYRKREKRQHKSYTVDKDYLLAHLVLHKMGIYTADTVDGVIKKMKDLCRIMNNAKTKKIYLRKFFSTLFCTYEIKDSLIDSYELMTDGKASSELFKKNLGRLLIGELSTPMNKLSTKSPPLTARSNEPPNRPSTSSTLYYKNTYNTYSQIHNNNARARGIKGKPDSLSSGNIAIKPDIKEILTLLSNNCDVIPIFLKHARRLNTHKKDPSWCYRLEKELQCSKVI